MVLKAEDILRHIDVAPGQRAEFGNEKPIHLFQRGWEARAPAEPSRGVVGSAGASPSRELRPPVFARSAVTSPSREAPISHPATTIDPCRPRR